MPNDNPNRGLSAHAEGAYGAHGIPHVCPRERYRGIIWHVGRHSIHDVVLLSLAGGFLGLRQAAGLHFMLMLMSTMWTLLSN